MDHKPTHEPLQQDNQPSPQPEKIMANTSSRLPILLAVLAGVILIGSAVILVSKSFFQPKLQPVQPLLPVATSQPTQTLPADPTAGWKTYKNEEYGFEIKYPENWIAVETPQSTESINITKQIGGTILFVGFKPEGKTYNGIAQDLKPFGISVQINKSLGEELKLIGTSFRKDSAVNDISAIEVTGDPLEIGENWHNYYINRPDIKSYIIIKDGVDDIKNTDISTKEQQDLRDAVNVMLSTFKFLE